MTEAGHVAVLDDPPRLIPPGDFLPVYQQWAVQTPHLRNGNLKDVIYHVYGREITANLLKREYEKNGIPISGFLGAPLISRGNRNFETYFINGRYIKSQVVYKAIEDGYKDFTMQHKYPFVVLHIELDAETVDVNVHPAKMELRFGSQQEVYNAVFEAVDQTLHGRELIPEVGLDAPEEPKPAPAVQPALPPNQHPALTSKAAFRSSSLPASGIWTISWKK